MTRSQGRSWNEKRRYERTGALVLGRARVKRAVSRPLPRWLRKVLRILLLLLVLIIGVALWATFDSRFYVYSDDVRVEGTRRVPSEAVFEASGLSGLHILWADSAQIEERILEALPMLRSVQVSCRLPARCALTVVERQPVVIWDDEGQVWWIDAEGKVFPAEGQLSEDAVPGQLVRGPLPRNEEGHLKEEVSAALSELEAKDIEVPRGLRYVPGKGLAFTDERGWYVILGKGTGMGERLQLFERLAAHLTSRGVTPGVVDVRFPSASYYTLADE